MTGYSTGIRDALAAAITAAGATLAVGLSVGGGGGGGTAAPALPPCGNLAAVGDARSPLDPAACKDHAAASGPKSSQRKPDPTRPPQAETRPQATAEHEPAAPGEPASPAHAETARLQPTLVEAAPKEICTMTNVEIRQAVERYREWIHEGRYVLRLDHSEIPLNRLTVFVWAWILSSRQGNRMQIEPSGAERPCEALPPGMLIGDLPRSQWPSEVVRGVEKWFGRDCLGAACAFILAPPVELKIFRDVGQATGAKPPPPGTEFLIRLRLRGEEVHTELARVVHHGDLAEQGRTRQ